MLNAFDADGDIRGASESGEQDAAKALPSVMPKPASSGSATMRAKVPSVSSSTLS